MHIPRIPNYSNYSNSKLYIEKLSSFLYKGAARNFKGKRRFTQNMNQINPGKDDFSKARTNSSHLKNDYFRTDRTFFRYILRV